MIVNSHIKSSTPISNPHDILENPLTPTFETLLKPTCEGRGRSYFLCIKFEKYNVFRHLTIWKVMRVCNFWIQGLPVGIHSNRPCPSVRLSVFEYLRDRSLVFSETLHEVRGQLSKKVTRPRFWEKILIRRLRGIKCRKSGFLDIFSETDH